MEPTIGSNIVSVNRSGKSSIKSNAVNDTKMNNSAGKSDAKRMRVDTVL
jgi:hypothetical protein